MTNLSIPYYSGPLMPDEFSEWLSTCPLKWQMLEITKDQGSYVFYIEDESND
tara:strand:+ start:416 stop:571 length:156 start_codon:yes stop_codon:yes gene_type:complete